MILPASVSPQFSLDLSRSIDHHEQLHHAPHGTVIYWERAGSGKKWMKIAPGDSVEKLIARFTGGIETYLTVNEFINWRVVRQLKSLRCCYVDVDGNTDLEAILDALKVARMPPPTFIVYSGRGIHLYWVLEPTPAKALPVWQRVQDALVKALAGVGSDANAKDCARVLRLVGSVNAKNGAEVRGLILTGMIWTLHKLADEVLGSRKAAVFDFAAAGARQHKPMGKPRSGSIYDWWHLVYRDLIVIADHHWFGGVPDGHRDQFLFLMSVALSWFAHPDVLKDEIVRTARSFTPTLSLREVETQMACVISRAKSAAAGNTILYRNAQVDPRYRFKAETLREWLGDLIAPDYHDQLRALAPEGVILQRKKTRDAGRDRVVEGRYAMHRTDNADKRVEAIKMKAGGLTQMEIAKQLEVSQKTISQWFKIAN